MDFSDDLTFIDWDDEDTTDVELTWRQNKQFGKGVENGTEYPEEY